MHEQIEMLKELYEDERAFHLQVTCTGVRVHACCSCCVHAPVPACTPVPVFLCAPICHGSVCGKPL